MAGRARWSIDWQRVPWTLWAYVAVSVGDLIFLLTRLHSSRPEIYAVVFIFFWNYFLLRSVRWLWIVTLVFAALSLVFDLATARGSWWGDTIGIVQLVLLVLPPSRRFFDDRSG